MNRPCTCENLRHGRPWNPGRDCRECWLWWHDPSARRAWGGNPERVLPVSPHATNLPPRSVTRIPDTILAAGEFNARFNASLIRYRGRLLLAYRTGWAGSNVHVAELAEDLTPVRSTTLDLHHPRATYGREDPRLFVHRDRLHVAYVGVEGPSGPTSQLYARLTDDLAVEQRFYPYYEYRPAWEKNWGFFEAADGDLYAVYSVRPHVVFRIDGDRAWPAFGTDTLHPWSGGHLRGGAPPVRVGDEFVCWFHGQVQCGGEAWYSAGVYAFEAAPPFRVTRMTPDPVRWPDPAARPPDVRGQQVVFPAGAVLEGGVWRVSFGVHDRWTEVVEWDRAAVERALVPCTG